MKQYEQPQTRIKRVKDHNGERFYAQYKQVIIPHIWWEWQNTRESLDDEDYAVCLMHAKHRINVFLRKSLYQWACEVETDERKKVKKEVEYIQYP